MPLLVRWKPAALPRSGPCHRPPVNFLRLGTDRKRLGTFIVLPCQCEPSLFDPMSKYGLIARQQRPRRIDPVAVPLAREGNPQAPPWRFSGTIEEAADVRDLATTVLRLAMDAGSSPHCTAGAWRRRRPCSP